LYYEKFQDIIPNASARGRNAFSAMRTAPPIPSDDTLDDPTVAAAAEISTNDSAASGNTSTLINEMDIDQPEHGSDTTSIFTSNSFGKRKLDVITSDEELDVSESGNPIPSSKPSSQAASATPVISKLNMPAKKKTSGLSRSLPRSKNTSSTHSSHPSQPRAPAQSTVTKMMPNLIAHEIQGSINSLASAVRESGLTDPVAKLRQDAIHHVSDGDDGLSAIDKLAIIDLFRKDYPAVQTYMALLSHDNLRQPWLEKQLQELKD
jgi:hypothetical protein